MTDSASGQVAELYDSPGGQLGPALFGGHVHWGYWDQQTADASFAEAAERLAQIMISKTSIGPGQKFIDLGCGAGQAAVKLSQATGCSVDGITISSFQQQTASALAEAEGLADKLHFIHGNALQVPCANQTYDGGWFFESIFHMGHHAALQEAARILKPGALLALTDLPTLPHTSNDFRAFVRDNIHSTFVAREDYPALMQEAGFELLEIQDVTANVMPWLPDKLQEAMDTHQDKILEMMGDTAEKAMDDWLYMFEFMSENLGYMLVTAKRQ